MKNVTITLDDETHRAARIHAAELGTSLSALVKDYLQGLCAGQAPSGVREMPMPFHHAPPAKAVGASLPPGAYGLFPDGTPFYTKDGKPRKPGAMRGLGIGWTEDFDGWPDGFLDAIYGDDTSASNTWWLNANDVLKTSDSD
ncbi:MAG: hypothetical protein ACKVOJ_07360 [Sphingomonadaceae bacterium]